MNILLFNHGGSDNRGAEAIVRTAVFVLKEKFPNATISLSSYRPNTDLNLHGLTTVYKNVLKPIKKYSFTWFISSIKVKLFKDESYAFSKINADLYDLIPQFDIFISTGGDNYCYGEQPAIYYFDAAVKKANKKLILWGASLGEDDISPAKILDLKQFDNVLIRETYSEKILKKAGLKNLNLVGDGAFLLEKEELPLPKGWQEGNMIGLNYSPLVWKKNKNSKNTIIELIHYILKSTTFNIVLTPHVIQNGNDDYLILKEFYEIFKNTNRVLLLPNNLNASQYKGYIARMRFFIGARTHATIAAYSSFVPTLVLGYSVKSKGIAYDLFGEEKLVLSLDEIGDSNILKHQFDKLINEETILIKTLHRTIPVMQELAKNAVNYI